MICSQPSQDAEHLRMPGMTVLLCIKVTFMCSSVSDNQMLFARREHICSGVSSEPSSEIFERVPHHLPLAGVARTWERHTGRRVLHHRCLSRLCRTLLRRLGCAHNRCEWVGAKLKIEGDVYGRCGCLGAGARCNQVLHRWRSTLQLAPKFKHLRFAE